KRVAVAAGNERGAAGRLLGGGRRGKKIVGFVTTRLGVGETARRGKLGQYLELLDQLVVELPAALVIGEQLLAIGRLAERIPADEDGARLFALVKPHEEIGEPDNRAATLAAAAADRFRQRVVGAVGEIVAVDDQQRPAHVPLKVRPSLSE